MQTWVVDSSKIPLDQLKDFDTALVHRTPAIERFLAEDNQEVLAIVGPKGFGKTLLIHAKRAQLSHDGAITLPRNASVDKPLGDAPTLAFDKIEHIMTTRTFWKNIWLASFIICAAKEHQNYAEILDNLKCPEVAKCFRENKTNTPTYFFKILLQMLPSQYYALIEDFEELEPIFRSIHSPTYIFLDNVDELFDIHLQNGDDYRNSAYGIRRNQFWHSAQVGAFDAARNLSRINAHVRIYCSIRKEALEEGLRDDPQALQTRGACLFLEYSRLDLRSILTKNINAEHPSLLVSPKAADPFRRWVGEQGCRLAHDTTGEFEELPDYIIRHTLRRPRDIIFIGRAISEIAIGDRKASSIKAAVNDAAARIARDYLVECRPHLSGFDPELLFDLIDINTLTRNDIEQLSQKYKTAYAAKYMADQNDADQVFTTLYRIGLLGWVRRSLVDSNHIQTFRNPGGSATVEKEHLPESDVYLVHPILSDLIRGRFRPEYARNRNRLNIIEADRPWRMDTAGHFVLQGDLVNYSRVMNDVGSPALGERLERLVRDAGRHVLHCEHSAGDAVMLVDQHPRNIFLAANELVVELRKLEPAMEIRLGVDYGVLIPRAGPKGQPDRWHGAPIEIAERIRPRSKAGELTLTNEVMERLTPLGFPPEGATLVGDVDTSKNPEEPRIRNIWTYRLGRLGVPPCFTKPGSRPRNRIGRFGYPES